MRMALALLLALTLAGCVGAPPPAVSSACSWVEYMRPDPGFETRWTPAERANADRIDNKIAANCPDLKP